MAERLLVISNCQGPPLVERFLPALFDDFAAKYDPAPAIQVHRLRNGKDEARAGEIAAALDRADVILAQPVLNCPVEALTIDAVEDFAARRGRALITFPALHLPSLFLTEIGSEALPGHPMGGVDDAVLMAAFLLGLAPSAAARVFHETAIRTPAEARDRVAQNLARFEEKEVAHDLTLRASPLYRALWRDERLHHSRAHPTAALYRRFAALFAGPLELRGGPVAEAGSQSGNSRSAYPLKRWLAAALDLRIEDDPDSALVEHAATPFEAAIRTLYRHYEAEGRDAVAARLTAGFPRLKDRIAATR